MASLIWRKQSKDGPAYPYIVYTVKGGKRKWLSLTKWVQEEYGIDPNYQLTKSEARSYYYKWEVLGQREPDGYSISISDWFNEYRRQGEITKSRNTQRSDDSRLRNLEEWFNSLNIKTIGDITPVSIRRFRDWKSESVSATHVNRHLEILRACLNVAVDDGYLDINPARKVPPLKVRDKRQIRVLSEAEIAVIETFPTPALEFCLLALYAGLRQAEIIWLEWEDVDLHNKTVTIQGKPEFSPKGVEPRTIPLHDKPAGGLARLPRRGRYVFDSGKNRPLKTARGWYYLIVNKLFKEHGIKANIHAMRHTFVTRLVKAGVSPPVVQKLARHKNFATTLRYTHLDMGPMRDGLDKVS